jgi:uncharacterized damage-inducible protein DinB
MSISSRLLEELAQEMATTRRVIERVPTAKGAWRPHPKSFPIGHLAQLIAGMPGWFTCIASRTTNTVLELQDALVLDPAKRDPTKPPAYSYESTDDLLAHFDRHVVESRAAIAAVPDAEYDEVWSLLSGDRVLTTMSRYASIRETMSHLSHHRGQLTVYLRLLDIPVPSIYGPSADERGFVE